MPRITSPGTFVYCKGAIIIDGWQVDCEGGEVQTHEEVMKLVIKFLHQTIVEIPELQAKLASLKAIQRASGEPDA